MPKRKKCAVPHIADGANILFDKLVICERVGTIFYAGGRSRNYERCGAMTEEYVRELVHQLKTLLNDLDRERGIEPGHHVDRVDIERADGGVRFRLYTEKTEVCCGFMPSDVAAAAADAAKHAIRGNVVRIKRR